jgi:hypothetical protein
MSIDVSRTTQLRAQIRSLADGLDYMDDDQVEAMVRSLAKHVEQTAPTPDPTPQVEVDERNTMKLRARNTVAHHTVEVERDGGWDPVLTTRFGSHEYTINVVASDREITAAGAVLAAEVIKALAAAAQGGRP